jgi:hypothetical protein
VVNTDTEGDGATAVDPFETIVQLGSAGGPVSVTEELNDGPAPQGYGLLDYRVRITAPPGTVADPLVLTFRLDSTLLPPDLDVGDLAVLRNQVPIPACTHASSAVPDPCVAARAVLGDGDWQITVRTSAASDWEFGVAEPTAPDLGGPYTVDEGDDLVLDASGATSPIGLPLTHDWIPADRVDALAGGQGRVRTDDDYDGTVEVRVRDAIGGSATGATRVTVRNVAPSIGTVSLPATGSVNDPVTLDAEVSDPGTADTITATVDWGDGTVEDVPFDGTRVVGHHVYATTGARTVSVFVEDDDGGVASSGHAIDVAPAAQSGHTLWGVLRDATGAPVEGILVHALRTGGASVTCSRTDAAGVYRCPGGQGGYRLAVVGQFGFLSKYLPNGYGPNGAKVFRVGGSGHTRQDGVLYRLADTGQVAGQVSCGAVHGGYFCRSVGLAVKGATVQVYRPDGTVVVQTTTDDLGRFTIDKLEPGHYRVFVRRGVTSWAWFDDADSLGAAVEVLVERGITTVADQRLCGPGGSTCS